MYCSPFNLPFYCVGDMDVPLPGDSELAVEGLTAATLRIGGLASKRKMKMKITIPKMYDSSISSN